MLDYEICHCKKVNYSDIDNVLTDSNAFGEVIDAFKSVQEATSCSTGCGGCYSDVLDVISDIMDGYGPK